jgi:hypothetical protein
MPRLWDGLTMKLTPVLLAALAASSAAAVVSTHLAAPDDPPQCPVPPAVAASTPSAPLEWLSKAVPWLPAAQPQQKPVCGPCGMG